MTARVGLVLTVFIATGCIRVPDRVKLNFCAQPSPANHFGSEAAATSCCHGMRQVYRFGAEERACKR